MSHSIHREVLKLEKLLKIKKDIFWIKRGQKNLLKRYEEAKQIPAYKKFLKKKLGKIPNIKRVQDFEKLPSQSKDNYLRLYPFKELFSKNKLNELPRVFSITSGSTGEPFYFPRTEIQDKQYQLYAEIYLRNNFNIHKKKTLYIDAFPMGPWIGGVFTYEVITRIAREAGYCLSIITTGIDTPSIMQTIEKIGQYYDQIIIGSYGPFAKDVLDHGIHEGVNWRKYNIKFVFSAEAFPESFRDYVGNIIGSKNIFFDTLNHYGTVDLGTMSYETPVCILIRKLAEKNQILYKKIFGDIVKIPTLTQYLPELFYFESNSNNIYCTSESAIPLVRYDLGDHGNVVSFKKMISLFREFNIDLIKEARKYNIEKSIWELPFVYVFERSDFSVSYYAFQVYPGPIRKVLFNKKIQKKVTGKFTLESSFSKDQNPKLIVNVELKRSINFSVSLLKEVQKLIHNQLIKTHSEYREIINHFGKKVQVSVVLWENGDQRYFKTGVKQKWIKK